MRHGKQVRFLWVVSIVLLGACSGSEVRTGTAPASLPRFFEVAPGIYRGGQPGDGGYAWLKQRGVKTIINLRREYDERQTVESMGFQYIYLPLDATEEIPQDAIQTFLKTVSDPASQPVFVHCQRGADRTGFMIGIFRIARQGWSPERAYNEAREIGMRWWYLGLRRQLFEFAEESHPAAGESSRK